MEDRIKRLEDMVEYLAAKIERLEAQRTGGQLSPQPPQPPQPPLPAPAPPH